jgi:MFS family permease
VESRTGFVRAWRGVIVLGILCFLIMLTEGAVADWSGLYLSQNLGTSTAAAALAFAAFAAGMTGGRMVGDRLNRRLGAAMLMRAGSALAAVALGALLLAGDAAVAIVGCVLVGLGLANGVPLVFSAAGHARGRESAPSIGAVSSMGSLGFLAGPPFIGFLADATSLPLALSTLCGGLTAVTLAAGATRSGAGVVAARPGIRCRRPEARAPRQAVVPFQAGSPPGRHQRESSIRRYARLTVSSSTATSTSSMPEIEPRQPVRNS